MSEVVTILWETVPGGLISPAEQIGLGDVEIPPGSTTPKEIKVYWSSAGSYSKLTGCGLYLALYSRPYPTPQEGSAYQDFIEVKRWGDLIGLTTQAGILINMNKAGGYPETDWRPLNSQAGCSPYNRLGLLKESVQLSGGGYHTIDGELPAGANAFFKIKVSVPAGVERVGNRFISLIFAYESAS